MNPTASRSPSGRPNQPDPKRATPPVEEGVVLAEFDRDDGVLRVSVNTYKSFPFVSLRIWTRDHAGGLWPSKRGVTIKRREVAEFAEAAAAAVALVAQYEPQSRVTEADRPGT